MRKRRSSTIPRLGRSSSGVDALKQLSTADRARLAGGYQVSMEAGKERLRQTACLNLCPSSVPRQFSPPNGAYRRTGGRFPALRWRGRTTTTSRGRRGPLSPLWFVHHASDIVRIDNDRLRCKQCGEAFVDPSTGNSPTLAEAD